MNWIRKWKNQYGSILEITKQENGKLEGTGMFYKGKMETVWHVVTAKTEGAAAETRTLAWWESVKTNVDTFERSV